MHFKGALNHFGEMLLKVDWSQSALGGVSTHDGGGERVSKREICVIGI